MRKLFLVVLLLGLPLAAEAQSVTCTVSGLNAGQATRLAEFLASVNAERAARVPPLPPFANFNAYCSDLVVGTVLDYIRQAAQASAAKVALAAEANGLQTAPAGQCTATGQAAGCTKASVACFALSGNIGCN